MVVTIDHVMSVWRNVVTGVTNCMMRGSVIFHLIVMLVTPCTLSPDRTLSCRHTALSDISNRIVGVEITMHY